MKLFKTTDMQIVEICRDQFNIVLPSMQLVGEQTLLALQSLRI